MTTPGILAYVSNITDGITGVPTGNVLYWPGNNQFFHLVAGAASTAGIRQFTGYVSGDETLGKNLAALGVLGIIPNDPCCVISPAGRIWFPDGSSNSPRCICLDAATLTVLGTFGTDSSSVGDSTPTRILSPYSANILVNGTLEYVVCGTQADNGGGEVNILPLPLMVPNTRVGEITERQAMIGKGPNTGTVFILGRPSNIQFPSTAALGLYTLTAGALLTRIGSINPADVDATWTHFGEASGPAYDATDGNPIILVGTADAVTNKYYLVKLNAATAAVLWTVALPSYDSHADADMGKHVIVNSTLYYLDAGSNHLYVINTAAGTSTNSLVSILQPAGGQVSEDQSVAASGFGSIFVYGSWAESGTHPAYLGDYMGTLGNHSVSAQWMRYIPAEPLTIAPPIPPPAPFPTVSTRKAWTYVLDGHTFYVLDLGAQGTFAYDVDTQHWSQFLSTSTTPSWNMQNGVMWGQRVVAGDLASGQVYELDPGVTKDDGNAVDIPHTATGGLVQRSRTYFSVAALRLALSLGYLGDAAGVNISLSYSDDNGNTFSTPVSIALAEGDYTTEVAFRSLGSFSAPGRIFSVTDTGGPLRIDGCDVDIDNFDDRDSGPQK